MERDSLRQKELIRILAGIRAELREIKYVLKERRG